MKKMKLIASAIFLYAKAKGQNVLSYISERKEETIWLILCFIVAFIVFSGIKFLWVGGDKDLVKSKDPIIFKVEEVVKFNEKCTVKFTNHKQKVMTMQSRNYKCGNRVIYHKNKYYMED